MVLNQRPPFYSILQATPLERLFTWVGKRRSKFSILIFLGILHQTFFQQKVDGACIEYEKVINGSGYRLHTCPLDNPPSFVYCCVDTCCEEPHLAVLVTSVLGGILICVIGLGLIILCVLDIHKFTCGKKEVLETPLLSEEDEDQETGDEKDTSYLWYNERDGSLAEDAPHVEINDTMSTQTDLHSDDLSPSINQNCNYMTEVVCQTSCTVPVNSTLS